MITFTRWGKEGTQMLACVIAYIIVPEMKTTGMKYTYIEVNRTIWTYWVGGMGGVSRLYILQKVEDTSLSLSEIYAEDKEVQLPAFS